MKVPPRSSSPQGGRPRLDGQQRQSCQVMVRFTERDAATLRDLAKRAGLPLQKLIRRAALEAKIPPRPPEVHLDCVGQLRRIGNNLNQALLLTYRGGGPTDLRTAILELLLLCREIRMRLLGEDFGEEPSG